MSGICGVIGIDGRPWRTDDVLGMNGMIALLGPDAGGSWSGTAGRCGVALAAALRRATPEDAHDRQPAEGGGRSLLLVADLRLDNRAELAGHLGLRDDGAVPDTSFVLAAYERWRAGMLERLVGEFALALVDRVRGGVLLARDHVGARPLCVHERPGVVAFASTALALTALEGVGHHLDLDHAAENLAAAFASGRTFVDGVRWFPAGTAMWIDAAGTRRWPWWNPDPDEIDASSPFDAHARSLRGAFDDAVAARLRSSGQVGATVSGGLDSTSAAATAAAVLAPDPLPIYTSAPPPGWSGPELPKRDNDESHLVRALAAMHPNMMPTFVHMEPGRSLFGLHEPLWELGAAPARNPCNVLWVHALRERAAADGVSTLMTGDQGNLFFSADGAWWLAASLRAGRVMTTVREAAAWRRSASVGSYRILRDHIVRPLLPPRVIRLGRRMAGRPDELREWLRASGLRPEAAAQLDLAALLPHLDHKRREGSRPFYVHYLRDVAGQADFATALVALTGVESRDPTSDRRVIEVALRQPEWVRRHQGVTRAVARAAMVDRLPDAIAARTRRGEQLPDWLDLMTAARAELVSELEQAEQHPTSRELIDTARLRALVDHWPDRDSAVDLDVMRDYRLALLRSLVVSRYLRWFEGRAAEAARPSRRASERAERLASPEG